MVRILAYSDKVENAWDQRYRERFVEDEQRARPEIKDSMRMREAQWVIVESYEWESGMA